MPLNEDESWQHEECLEKVSDQEFGGVGLLSQTPARPAGRRGDAGEAWRGTEDGRLRITFHGAARQVTGSAHLLEIGPHRILLDCGLFDSDRIDPDSPNRSSRSTRAISTR